MRSSKYNHDVQLEESDEEDEAYQYNPAEDHDIEDEEFGNEEEEELDPEARLAMQEEERLALLKRIVYSDRYRDNEYEYRHVLLPKTFYLNYVPKVMKHRLLSEDEWRGLGIQQSPGWVHYELHKPEPHIFLFRRKF